MSADETTQLNLIQSDIEQYITGKVTVTHHPGQPRLIAHVPEQQTYAPRPIQLPAVLQIAGDAPFFGTIASLSEQGLAFDFQTCEPPPQVVGQKTRLDFDFQGQHYTCNSLFIHLQGNRALLSLREASPALLAALHSVNRLNTPNLATSLSVLQRQHAVHHLFMDSMKTVVNDFYLMVPGYLQTSLHQPGGLKTPARLAHLQNTLDQIRPHLIQRFTKTYPMYPESGLHQTNAGSAASSNPIDMEKVDDWIRRTTIAQKVNESIGSLSDEFNLHYATLQIGSHKSLGHPYQPDAVLNILADLIAPLGLDADERLLCFQLMGQALQKEAGPMYQAMMQTIGVETPESALSPEISSNLAMWLKEAARHAAPPGGITDTRTDDALAGPISELTALLVRLTENLDDPGERQHSASVPSRAPESAASPIPGLLARDRIANRFLPAMPAFTTEEAPLQGNAGPTTGDAFGNALGGLTDLDSTALENLRAQLMRPPAIDPGPEKLSQASQVRALMLQAQGLVLEYTLNGLTYQSQPDHPAWALINALDALHRGADDRGQFLDPALYKATSLAMQWLLGQENTDTALEQVNALLARINAQFLEAQQSRREHYLSTLGSPAPADAIHTDWCVIKQDEEAIPYEVLGKFDDKCALLNRSATRLLEIPTQKFVEELDDGLIEEAGSFNEPFLKRTASATLTASLGAIHTYTWQDPACGCLKRTALMDALERRLIHPVSEPPSFCALVEIPGMRSSLSPLPGEDLAVMQKRSGELLQEMMEHGEQCGRLSDVTFLMIFSPQEPDRVADRLTRLKIVMENLHPTWKMNGAVVPLVNSGTVPTPSDVLRRANLACSAMRQHYGLDLSCLSKVPAVSNQINPLPFSSLYLRCQKIASCIDGARSHYEILLGVDEDLVPGHTTQSFVVMAEQTGRIHDLDTWVLKSVLEWMDGNASGLDQLSGLSVNLSGNSLTQTDHIDAMVSLLSDYPHLTNKLILEVTETAMIDSLDGAVRSLSKLRALGCRIALDDFGSGYSSYGYVRRLPLDYLKIDGTYIRNIVTDKTDQALTASMVDVAHALGLKVIAEYVDSEAAFSWLKDQGVDYVQGYWVHKPQRLDTLVLS